MSTLSPKLKHFFDWYEAERPCWETVLRYDVELTWLENRAWNAALAHINLTLNQGVERPVDLSMQQVFENHAAWFRNLVTAQLDIWQNTPRA